MDNIDYYQFHKIYYDYDFSLEIYISITNIYYILYDTTTILKKIGYQKDIKNEITTFFISLI